MGRIILDETVHLAGYFDVAYFTSVFNLVNGNSYKVTIGANVYPNLVALDRGVETVIGDENVGDPPFCLSDGQGEGYIFVGNGFDGNYRIVVEDLSAVEHETLTSLFTDIANSIRAKTGDTGQIVADSFPEAIDGIPTGTARSASDLTVSGATVTVPAGLYSAQATKSVASGSAGTPSASKGTVSNNSVTVTPSVTNTTGYITGGTKTGTGVTVSASELVSGNKALTPSTTAQTNIDVTNYATASVASITKELLASLDADFVADNIKKDVDLFGLVGTLESGGGGGGGGSTDSGVRFLDYDCPAVETWEPSTVAGKTALPNNPTHAGLVAQGWNWSLVNIKSYIAKYPDAIVNVGQMYKTVSGLTEIDITVTKVTGLTITCNMVGNKNWGDGTTDSATTHTYADYGDYTITCDGTSIPAGSTSSGGMFATSSSNVNRYWCTAIRVGERVTSIGSYAFNTCYSLASITIPDSVTSIGNSAFYRCFSLASITIPDSVTSIGNSAFNTCYSLASITIPDSVTSIGYSAFNTCYSLASITIPDSVTSIGSSAFSSCFSLASITIPDSVTSIGNSAFNICYSLASITIPDSVTSIGDSAFYRCYSLTEYDFSAAQTVPTLSNTNAFGGINGICKILVPVALYDDWIAATNWTTYADYIYPV